MNQHYRQGDVLLVKMKALPENAKREENCDHAIILAHGEVTGHTHRLSSEYAEAYQWNGGRLVDIQQVTALVHEEHNPISLEPGVYRVVIQREYTPSEVRPVLD